MAYHEKLKAGIARHPKRAALVMGLLVVLVIILSVCAGKHRKQWMECKNRSSFLGLHWAKLHPKSRANADGGKCRDRFEPSYASSGKEFNWTVPVCQAAWDPAAVAESQALAEMGSLSVDRYGAKRLKAAAAGEDDVRKGPTNSELISLMKYGFAP